MCMSESEGDCDIANREGCDPPPKGENFYGAYVQELKAVPVQEKDIKIPTKNQMDSNLTPLHPTRRRKCKERR